jgi:Glycosyl hydrolase family 67 N-terminus
MVASINHRVVSVVLLVLGVTQSLSAGPKVNVVLARDAPKLERFAAEELAGQFRKLFEAEVTIGDSVPSEKTPLIVVGSPKTNPALKPIEAAWPELSYQGHLLKSVRLNDRPALVVGGGSSVATLWAAYELGHRFGIRYFLFGDLYPVRPPELKLDGIDVVLEPTLKLRTWRTVNDFPIGPESWGLAEQRVVLKQLAKLKYNRVMLAFYPWQPFVDFEFKGVKRQSDKLWFGWKYRVDGDTAGRGVFAGAKFFDNPDFVGKTTYAERIEAGTTLARGIIDAAHDLGMTAAIAISPLEFPREFAAVLPNARPGTELEPLSIGPGPSQPPDDPLLLDLARTQIRAYVQTYRAIDAIYLTLPEFPDWVDHAEASWKRLDQQTGIGKTTSLEALIDSARKRTVIASGDRGVRALRGNIAGLDFLRTLLADEKLLRTRGVTIPAVLVDTDPALYPYLDKLLPPRTNALHFVDYTARRVVENRALLAKAPVKKVASSLILTLADDNVGLLPQFTGNALHALVGDLREQGWQGFSTRYWIVGDLDLSAYYLSRASFDAAMTPERACLELLTPVTDAGVPESVWKGFAMIEQATNLIDANDIGFGFPVPGIILKHYTSDAPVPGWWGEVRDLYLNAMNEMYRANSRAREGGRAYSLYCARRYEFAFEYMNCVEAVRQAGIARRAGDAALQRSKLESAVESIHSALNALAAVARSNSDRGVIAVLNEYGYRPLKAELEKLDEAAAKE